MASGQCCVTLHQPLVTGQREEKGEGRRVREERRREEGGEKGGGEKGGEEGGDFLLFIGEGRLLPPPSGCE